MIEHLIHKADGSLTPNDPYYIGREVEKLHDPARAMVPVGTKGYIIETPPNYSPDANGVWVRWNIPNSTYKYSRYDSIKALKLL